MSDTSVNLRMTVYSSLMAALIAAGAFIAIPVGPVPIVLQNLFVLLAGLLLGWRGGFASVTLYLLAGVAYLPVFSGGRSGIAHIGGPTGGYLLSYLVVVLVVGWISEQADRKSIRGRGRFLIDLVALVVGSIIVYACGVPWLKYVTGMPWDTSIAVGVTPFLIGDAAKVIAAAILAKMLRPIIRESLSRA